MAMSPACRTVAGVGVFDWLSVGQQWQQHGGALVCDSGFSAFWRPADSGVLRDPGARRRFAVQQAVWVWHDHLLFFSKDRMEAPPPDAPYACAAVRVRLLDPNADPRLEDDPEPPLLPQAAPRTSVGGVSVSPLPEVAPWLEAALVGPPPGPPCARFLRHQAHAAPSATADYDAHVSRKAYEAMLDRVCARRAAGAAVVARPASGPVTTAEGRLPDRVLRHNRPADLLREYRDCGGQPALLADLRQRYARALAAVSA